MAANDRARGYVFEVDPTKKKPVAIILPAELETVIGAIVKLDCSSSFDPDGNPLTYHLRFVTKPIGSQVLRFGFNQLETDGSIVSFAPDITGHYKIGLIVNNGKLDSDEVFSEVDVKVILTPQDKGIVPDASFIWNYLSDFWSLVADRRRFEVLWSACIQLVAAETLKLWQYDYNKSIKDIQELFQRRWISYEPPMSLDETQTSFILANDQAGLNASTLLLDPRTGVAATNQPDYSTNVSVPKAEGNFLLTSYRQAIAVGRILQVGRRSFTLARAGALTDSVNYGEEGHSFVAVAGSADFFGSGFTAAQQGMTLRILSGPEQGDYLIVTFVDETAVKIQNLDGSSPTLTENIGLLYTVLPTTTTRNVFFADRAQVPTRLDKQPWRFSSTLVSTQHDFEAQAVSPGDVLSVEVRRVDNNMSGTFNVQIVSVDRNRLGFVFNLADLVDGVAAGGLSDDTQLQLAESLRVTGLLVTVNSTFLYTEEAALVRSTINSIAFRRRYFETALTSSSVIDVGAFSVRLIPKKIVRNSGLPLDPSVVSVPTLQEFIKQPDLATVGRKLVQVTDEGQFALDHEPYIVFENLDYIIDDEAIIAGTCNLTAANDIIEVPFGDLIDRSVSEGDTLNVTVGAFFQPFTVLKVVDAEKLRVFPTPTLTAVSAAFRLLRRVQGKYLRFIPGAFTKTRPAPNRLWAEVTFFDNDDVIEDNFGALVGVTREDLRRQNAGTPYRTRIAGLMFALTGGPVVANLQLAAQVLFGLPFTQNAGFIREINPDYRLRDDGSRLLGRIVVQATNRDRTPAGITNIYFYPQGRHIPDPDNPGQFIAATEDTAGLGINPDTGVEFQVGDFVGQFTPLSKGARIDEYLSQPNWVDRLVSQGDVGAQLRKYHSFRLTASADIVRSGDVDLAAKFLRAAKPHYTKLEVGLLRPFEDYIRIEDAIEMAFGSPPSFAEITSMSLPRAPKADNEIADLAFMTEGLMYSWYYSGDDLVTPQNAVSPASVTSATGGLIDAIIGSGQSHDTPFIIAGDLLRIMEGVNKGDYLVSSVVSDTELLLDTLVDGVPRIFQTKDNQPFRIFRPIKNPIFSGSMVVTQNSDTVDVTTADMAGLFSAGVAADDILVFYLASSPVSGVSRIYRIADIDLALKQLILTVPAKEATGLYTGYVIREALLTRYPLHAPADVPQTGNFSNALRRVDLSSAGDRAQLALLRPGDQLIPLTSFDEGSRVYTVLHWKPSIYAAFVHPIPDFTSTESLKIIRPSQQLSVITADTFDRAPQEFLNLVFKRRTTAANLTGTDLLTASGSNLVSTDSDRDFFADGVASGDVLTIASGPDAGTYNVTEVLGTQLRIDASLTSTQLSPGIGYTIAQNEAGPDLTTTGGSDIVGTVSGEDFADMGVVPGDYLLVLENGDSTVDVGHGPGVYVIAENLGTQLKLVDKLTITNAAPGILYGIMRKRPNEG
jgi:hypothetical protein